MPKTPLHTLTWSQDHPGYVLATQGQLEHIFAPDDTEAWLTWLATATSFTFRGVAGRLNVYHEARGETAHYWYAYQTTGKRTRKRYLGQSARVTLTRLEAVAAALNQGGSAQDTPAQETMPSMPLLSTSLIHPLVPPNLVVRDRLLTRLDAAGSHRLTLLAASAGWGKTTLLSMWAARSRFPVAWLSLSELENDPARFWVAVIAALRHSGTSSPLVGERSLTLLRSPQPPSLDTLLGLLVQDLSRQDTATFLLLDDYQVINEQAIHDSLLFLLERLPAHLHLVLASRTDPPLPLARWRARGALLELRDVDLRFQENEASQFLTQTMALALAPSEVTALTQRTEGWITGLHLASLALAHAPDHASFIHRFAGSHRYLVDYVQEEILALVEQPLQDFLLHCAILSRLSAAFCQAVTAHANLQTCQQMLEQLERANLFLVPLDEERRWYRLHDLFREALLARLHATQPEMVRPLHLRAASMYEQQGEWSEAIAHRLAAADYVGAARVIEHTAEQLWLHGEIQTLARWIMALPDAVVGEHARLVLTIAYYLIASFASTADAQQIRAHMQVEQIMARVEGVLSQQGHDTRPPEEVAALQQRLRLLRAWMLLLEATTTGDVKFLHLSSQSMPQVEKNDEIIWQLISYLSRFVLYYTFLREGGVVVPELQEMKQRISRERNRYATLKVTQWLALASVRAGQLHLAYQEGLAVQTLLQQIEGHATLAGYGNWGLADVLYQWNRLEEVRAVSEKMVHDAAPWQQIELQSGGYVFSAKYALATKDLESADQAIQALEDLLQQERWKTFWAPWLTVVQVRYWLATGNLTAANDWAAHVVFHPENWNPRRKVEFLTLIHMYCVQQRYTLAIEMLERFRAYLDLPGDIFDTIGFLALSLVALHHAGKHAQVREVAARLFALTEPEGFLRVYLDEGEPMRRVLQDLLNAPEEDSSFSHSYVSVLLAAFEQEGQRSAEMADASPANPQETQSLFPQSTSALAQAALSEPLTAQERRVLRLLAAGHSTQEIAQVLVVSPNTVKTHLRNLYDKLQVNSRTQALALARDLQLL